MSLAESNLIPEASFRPTTYAEAIACVRQTQGALRIVGSGTKSALCPVLPGSISISTARLTGIKDYQPTEFTITVLGGTRLLAIEETLGAAGQFLPFDPPLAEQGATIGGTIAAGLSGPSRLRYGGVRDFVIGARLVDGLGNLVTAGGKVVKNAAGFDIPKMLVGSRGRLGLIVELTMKVFPRPTTYQTLVIRCRGLVEGLSLMDKILSSGFEMTALDLLPSGEMWLRSSGPLEATAKGMENGRRIAREFSSDIEVLENGLEEVAKWKQARDFGFVPEDFGLAKIPCTRSQIERMDECAARVEAVRRYSAAGNIAWLGFPMQNWELLHQQLVREKLSGIVLRGEGPDPRLGVNPAASFARRIESTIDPHQRFAVELCRDGMGGAPSAAYR